MPVSDVPDEVEFRTSSHSGGGGCVEVGWSMASIDRVVVRNTRSRDRASLTFTPHEWNAFVRGVKEGEFDLPEPV